MSGFVTRDQFIEMMEPTLQEIGNLGFKGMAIERVSLHKCLSSDDLVIRMQHWGRVLTYSIPFEMVRDEQYRQIEKLTMECAKVLRRDCFRIPMCECKIQMFLANEAPPHRDIDWRPTETLPEDYYAY